MSAKAFEDALDRFRIARDKHAVAAFNGYDVPEIWQEIAESTEEVHGLYAAAINRAERAEAELTTLQQAATELLGQTNDLTDCWRSEIVKPKDGGRDRASSNMEHNHLTHEAIADLREALKQVNP